LNVSCIEQRIPSTLTEKIVSEVLKLIKVYSALFCFGDD